jgi:DHA2 family multidrug resistance protein
MATIAGMEHSLSELGSNAHTAAISRLTGLAQQQSSVMAFNDIFLILTVLFLVLVVALPMVKKPAAQRGGGGGGH